MWGELEVTINEPCFATGFLVMVASRAVNARMVMWKVGMKIKNKNSSESRAPF